MITDAYGGHGGIALYNRDLLEALCTRKQTELVVAVARQAPNSLEPMPTRLDYSVAPGGGIVSYLWLLVRQVFRHRPFDFILCGHINLIPFAWALSRWLGIPILLEIYGIEAWQPTSRKLANRLVRYVKLVTSISDYTRRRFLDWSGVTERDCMLLPNAIHAANFGMGEPSPELVSRFGLTGCTVILTLGRLVSQDRAKGFDEVLEVLPELIEEIPNIMYVIAGDGPDRDRLKAKADFLRVEQHVVFTGGITESEKTSLYRAADVYVMPSRGEGFGFVFLEAMACGTSVIASNRDGSLEAVQNGKLGQFVDPDDPIQVRAAILHALSLPRRIPEGLAYFSFENFCIRLDQVVQRMTAHA